MKKTLVYCLVVGLSFFLYQCDNNNEVLENQTDKMKALIPQHYSLTLFISA